MHISMFRGQGIGQFCLQQQLQISMTLAWRQGMNQEVKKKVISMLTSEERIQMKEEYFKYLKYSQFYKICINKYGSRCPRISEGFKNQQQYFKEVSKHLSGIRKNISSLMFGFTKMAFQFQQGEYITIIPKKVQTLEDFKTAVDLFIKSLIKNRLLKLNKEYSVEKIKILKEQINEMMAFIPTTQQSFNQSHLKWQTLITQLLNFNCLQQVLHEIHTTYTNITTFRSELSHNSTIIHGQKVLYNLYNYGLTHRQTQYNNAYHGK